MINQFDYVGQGDSSLEQTCAGSSSPVFSYMQEQVFVERGRYAPPGFQAVCKSKPRTLSVWIKTSYTGGGAQTAVATGAEEDGKAYNIRTVNCQVGVMGYNRDHTTTLFPVCC